MRDFACLVPVLGANFGSVFQFSELALIFCPLNSRNPFLVLFLFLLCNFIFLIFSSQISCKICNFSLSRIVVYKRTLWYSI